MKGLLVKGIAGFYYVKTEDGKVYECKARGIFKKEGITPTIGDEVEIEPLPDAEDEAVLEKIYPRKNIFIRPPICNVDTLIIVTAAAKPDPSFQIIDRFLVMAEEAGTEAIICVNKIDLASDEILAKFREIYELLYPLHFLCTKQGEGIKELKEALAGRRCALAGPSGVGKSTLVNKLENVGAETGKISERTGRGKQTTRHTEIFEMEYGGMIFDTPGFTSFEVLEADEQDLPHFYPEIAKLSGRCRYDNCRHLKEPGCVVREAVKNGEIHISRYRSYVGQIQEIIEKEKNRY